MVATICYADTVGEQVRDYRGFFFLLMSKARNMKAGGQGETEGKACGFESKCTSVIEDTA